MAWEISAKRNSDGACALLYSLDFIVVNNFKTDAEIALFEIRQPRFTKHTLKFSLYFNVFARDGSNSEKLKTKAVCQT